MRRSTQWVVFTSMNQQQAAWRSMIEPAEPADAEPGPDTSEPGAPTPEPLARPAPDTRRDRVELM